MALEMKKTSRWWYARIRYQGKLVRFPLVEFENGEEKRLEIKGRRPSSLKCPEEGDAAFFTSYYKAKAAHDRLKNTLNSRNAVEVLSQRIIEAKTGTRLDFVKIEAIPDAWERLPRKRKPSEQYVKTQRNTLQRFADYMLAEYPGVEDLASVRADQVRAFLDAEAARGIAPRTWNITLKLLKMIFAKLEPNADAYRSFLRLESEKDEDTIHRAPFTDEETEAILEAAKEDDVLRGPLVVAICTAMRKGDCCLLKWSSVDLEQNFIEVRTSKTGETAEIPIMPLLREELLKTKRTEKEFVFQEAAACYQHAPQSLDGRFNKILAAAGFASGRKDAESAKGEEATSTLPVLPVEALRERGLKTIERSGFSEGKRKRMKESFLSYLEGISVAEVAKRTGMGKGTVSAHLNEIEGLLGVTVVRRVTAQPKTAATRGSKCTGSGSTGRIRRGSVRGWHSFRTGFITRALSSGMPEELVRRVTGHSAVDVVRKYYFRPDRDDFRKAFENSMPTIAQSGSKSTKEQMLDIIDGMNAKTWKRDIKRLRALAGTL